MQLLLLLLNLCVYIYLVKGWAAAALQWLPVAFTKTYMEINNIK